MGHPGQHTIWSVGESGQRFPGILGPSHRHIVGLHPHHSIVTSLCTGCGDLVTPGLTYQASPSATAVCPSCLLSLSQRPGCSFRTTAPFWLCPGDWPMPLTNSSSPHLDVSLLSITKVGCLRLNAQGEAHGAWHLISFLLVPLL